MEKLSSKKIILITIISLVVIAVVILGVILFAKNKGENKDNTRTGAISLTESEFEALKIKNIEVTYKEDTSETVIDFEIENTTDKSVEKQTIDIQLLDENEGVIAGVQTYVETIDPKGSHKVDLMLAGNIEGIKKIKLVKPEEATQTEE